MKKIISLFMLSAVATNLLLVGCGGSGSTDTEETTPIEVEVPVIEEPTESNLVINEIVASAVDSGNDWFELYAVDGDVDLSEYSIVDNDSTHALQDLPSVTLSEGEYIVIYAVDEAETSLENDYTVDFKLGSSDSLTLYKGETEVDNLSWSDGDAPEGYSFGLLVDGVSGSGLLEPTPGATNVSSEYVQPDVDTIINESPSLRINEIVAKDLTGGYDWIEFIVTGDTAISLGDYSISDEDGIIVTLPDADLSPGDLYRVYATTDLDTNLATVEFKLGSSDELNLYLDTDLVDQLSWKKGQALIGQSFGRFPDASDRTAILTPSPLLNNALGEHGPLIINEVVATTLDESMDWFELYNSSDVDINLSTYQVLDESDDIDPISLPDVILVPGQYITIYATEDDTDEYSVGFKLGKNDELNLMLNDEVVDYLSWEESEVSGGFSFGLVDNLNSWAVSTLTTTPNAINEVPEVFHRDEVTNLYIDIDDDKWQDILDYPLEEEYQESTLTYNGISLDTVGIRTKGGSSLEAVSRSTSDRYSFKVDINEYVDDQMFFGLKKFVLQNSYNDPSYMREVIAYDLLDDLDVPTPQRGYVNLYINNELFGLYVMVEVIDSTFIDKHFDNDNGDLYKPDGEGSDLLWAGDDISNYSEINLKTNEDTSDNGAFLNLVEELDEGDVDSVDIDLFLRYMAVSVALSNLDSYHGTLAHNYYLYEQDGIFSFLPWDFNESFGTFTMNCRSDVRNLYIDEPTDGTFADRPLVSAVFADQNNLDTYHDYLWQLINGPLANGTFAEKVADIETLISEHVENDPSGFYGFDYFEQNLDNDVGQFFGLTSFMTYRITNMQLQLLGEADSSNDGRGFCN